MAFKQPTGDHPGKGNGRLTPVHPAATWDEDLQRYIQTGETFRKSYPAKTARRVA